VQHVYLQQPTTRLTKTGRTESSRSRLSAHDGALTDPNRDSPFLGLCHHGLPKADPAVDGAIDPTTEATRNAIQMQEPQPVREISLKANTTPGSDRSRSIKLHSPGSRKQQLAGSILQEGPYNSLSEFELDCLYIDRQQLFGAHLPTFASLLREALLRQDEELRASIQGYVPLTTVEQVNKFSERHGGLAGNKRFKTIGADAVVDGLYERGNHRRQQTLATAYGGAREDLVNLYSPRKDVLGIRLPRRRPHKKDDIREALVDQDKQLRALFPGYQPLLTVEDVKDFKAKHSPIDKAKSSHDTSANVELQSSDNQAPQKKKKTSNVGESLQNQWVVKNANLQLARPLLNYNISPSRQNQRVRKTVNLQGAASSIPKKFKGLSSAFQPDVYPAMQEMAINYTQSSTPSDTSGSGILGPHRDIFSTSLAMGAQVHARQDFNERSMHPGVNGMLVPQSQVYPQQLSNHGFAHQSPSRSSTGRAQDFGSQNYAGSAQVQYRQHPVNSRISFLNHMATEWQMLITYVIPPGQPHGYARSTKVPLPSSIGQVSATESMTQIRGPSFSVTYPRVTRLSDQVEVASDATAQASSKVLTSQEATAFYCPYVLLDESRSQIGEDSPAFEAHRSWYYGLEPSATTDSTARGFNRDP
jgi:hypothetical protein